MKKLLAFLIIFTIVSSFSLSVSASDFNFYGSLRYNTMIQDMLPFYSFSDPVFDMPAEPKPPTDRDTLWGLQGNSRLGANIKLSDKISGVFELGVSDDALSVRLFYGIYDFGIGKLLIGKTDHPFSEVGAYSNQIWGDDDGLGKHGSLCVPYRPEMIKLIFGGFQLAFIETNTNVVIDDLNDWFDHTGQHFELRPNFNYDVILPQIAAEYSFKYNNLTFEAVGAYQNYEVEFNPTSTKYDITAYAFKAGIKGEFGRFMIGGTYGFGQNPNAMGIDTYTIFGKPFWNSPIMTSQNFPTLFFLGHFDWNTGVMTDPPSDQHITNVKTKKAFTIIGGFKVNDIVRLEAGYGYLKNEKDMLKEFNLLDIEGVSSYYLQVPIKIAEGFFITPEVGRIDYFKRKTTLNGIYYESYDDGEINYFGVQFKIDF